MTASMSCEDPLAVVDRQLVVALRFATVARPALARLTSAGRVDGRRTGARAWW